MKSIDAVHALVHFGVSSRGAKRTIENVISNGSAVVHVPLYGPDLIEQLQATGMSITRLDRPARPDPRLIRQKLGMTAVSFAAIYRLNPRTLEGWEQGRDMDEAAVALLSAIDEDPDGVARAIERAVSRAG